jgi:hypothetical protein
MKTVVNKTRKPIKIPLPQGKALHLGPGKTGQVRDDAVERTALKKLIDAGEVQIVEGGELDKAATGGTASPHRVSQGHGKSSFRQKTGDR